jgi:hypothetical protein
LSERDISETSCCRFSTRLGEDISCWWSMMTSEGGRCLRRRHGPDLHHRHVR